MRAATGGAWSVTLALESYKRAFMDVDGQSHSMGRTPRNVLSRAILLIDPELYKAQTWFLRANATEAL